MTKEERAEKARKHREHTLDAYTRETEYSIKYGRIYSPRSMYTFNFPPSSKYEGKIDIQVIDCKTEETIGDLWTKYKSVCILNFASFTRPGGGFLNGAIAQEEALCHNSNLYDILVSYKSHYDDNYKYFRKGGLYTNWAIWNPDVSFIYYEGTAYETCFQVDVITCAAPNLSAYSNSSELDDAKKNLYKEILKSRCKFVLDIASDTNTSALVLGAFGCGVFGNSAYEVATVFKELLSSGDYYFEKVVFPVPHSNRDNNLEEFMKVFTE